jgi:hypothetical protein
MPEACKAGSIRATEPIVMTLARRFGMFDDRAKPAATAS